MTAVPQGDALASKFLGVQGNTKDPRVLLGIGPGEITDQDVIAALRARVEKIAAHPEANSIDADEVRLALHAAAARLLDPHTRRRLAATAEDLGAEYSIEANLLLTLGMYGGWNKEAMRRAAAMARAQGVEPERFADLIASLAQGSGTRAPATGERPAPARRAVARPEQAERQEFDPHEVLPEQLDPAGRNVRVVFGFVGAGIGGVIVLGVVVGLMLSGGPPGPASPPSGSTPSGPSSSQSSSAGAGSPEVFPAPAAPRPRDAERTTQAAPERVGDFGDVLRELSIANSGLEIDPEAAVARFEHACRQVAETWVVAAPDAHVAAANAQVEFVYRCATDAGRAERAVRAVTSSDEPADPKQIDAAFVAPAVWRAGMVARLLRERDLPSPVRVQARDAFAAIFAGTAGPAENSFRSGAIAGLTQIPARILPTGVPTDEASRQSVDAWRAWLRAVDALEGRESGLRQRLVLQSLERLLTSGPEPTVSRPVYDSVTALTLALTWRKGEESRAALLRWFDTPAISIPDLHTITSSLATQSGAEGVDYAMVLSLASGDAGRIELRDRYASVWGLSAAISRDRLVQQWIESSAAMLVSQVGDAPTQRLARSVELARVNEAAFMLWSGNVGGVPDVLALKPLEPSDPHVKPNWIPTTNDSDVAGSTWVVPYLAAGQHIPQRREILSKVQQAPSPLEADVLVEEAVRGSPVQVRQDARREVLKWANEPSIINSLLELAPMMPVTVENGDLVAVLTSSPLPSPRDPSWRVAVRRALVERLTELLADRGPLGEIDTFYAEFAETYRGRLGGDRTRGDGKASPIESSAAALRGRMLREAQGLIPNGREPVNLRTIELRRSARARIASGRVQQFAAEQVAVCELLAYMVANERPAAEAACTAVMTRLEDGRRHAPHIFDQLEAVERAMVELWRLRFGETQG